MLVLLVGLKPFWRINQLSNIVITVTATAITAIFNDAAREGEATVSHRRLNSIDAIELKGTNSRKGTYAEVRFSDGSNWAFDVENGRGGTVDTVAGVGPTDNADLVNKLAALI